MVSVHTTRGDRFLRSFIDTERGTVSRELYVNEDIFQQELEQIFARCWLFDVYRGDPLPPGTKSLAFAIDLRASDRTLTGEETEPVVTAIVERLRREFGAELRSG